MDNNKQSLMEKPEVPQFKLAKVGEKRRRKGAGIPWFGGGSGAGAWTGATGGSGLGGMIATLGGKVALIALVAALGIGAYSIGRSLAPDSSRFQASKKTKLFDSKSNYQEDTSKLPKDRGYGASSLGMVSGSLDGKTPAERAAEAAAAEAAAKAKAEADAQAAAAAGKEQPTEAGAAAGAASSDPAAMAAAAEAAAKEAAAGKGALGKKFGQLGSALAGGGGMSGGVTRGFDAPQFKSDNGKALAFGTGRVNPGRTTGRVVRAVQSAGRGLARRQLDTTYRLSDQARSGTQENASATADAAFNNNPGQGSAISGNGAGTGSSGQSGNAGSTPNPTGGSGPSASPNSSGDYGMDDCAKLFPDGGYMNSPSGGCISSVAGKSVDPTDNIVKLLKVLLIAATILSAIQLLISKMTWGLAEGARLAIWNGLALVLTGIGAVICLMGLTLVGMGRPIEGGLYAVAGGLIAGFAWMGHGAASMAATKAVAPIVAGLAGLMGTTLSFAQGPRHFNNESQRWE